MSTLPVARYRWLLYEFTRREITSRYAGSVTGLAWTLLQPLAQLAIFSFVFSQVFRATPPPQYAGASYTAFVAVALWPWVMFSEAIQRGMVSISGNAGLIRKVALPNRLFVYAAVLACYAVHLVGFLGVLVALSLRGESIHLAYLPVALLLLVPYMLIAAGIALALAALQTLLKDVEHGTAIVLSIVFYATPILYPVSLAPESWREAMTYSPLAQLSERLRDVLLLGAPPAAGDWILVAVAIGVFAAGLALFERLSPHFEDFL
jgi:ABC-type polysaccharide/polyol phosphate export permease